MRNRIDFYATHIIHVVTSRILAYISLSFPGNEKELLKTDMAENE